MAGRLLDKVAIVTGAGTGIGEAIAHTFAREGARLLLAGLPGDPVADVCAAIAKRGGAALPYTGNLAEEEHASACVQAAVDGFGRLDVLVNNAGVFLAVAETQDYPVDTAWTHKETGPMTEEMERTTVESTALGRLGTPEEVANVYAFLASDEAIYVTGALWAVDGGVTIAKGSVGTKVPDELRAEPEPTLPLRHSRDGLAKKNVRHAAE